MQRLPLAEAAPAYDIAALLERYRNLRDVRDDEDATAEIASNNVQMEVDDEERGVIVSDDFTSDTDAEKRIKKQSKRKKKGKG